MSCCAGTLRGISEPHCPHQFIRSHLHLWCNIPKGVIQTINDIMHNIEGNNLIVDPLVERVLPEYHRLSESYIGHATKLGRDK